MKFEIRKKEKPTAEHLYIGMSLIMCASVFLVYLMTSFGGESVPTYNSVGDLYNNVIKESAWYDFLGFSKLEEETTAPPDSIYTSVTPAGNEGRDHA